MPDSTQVIAVDPGDAETVESYLKSHGLELAAILLTHHHHDHIGGVEELTQARDIPVYGAEFANITTITHKLHNNQTFSVGGLRLRMVATPGHTLDHVVYILDDQPLHLFSGDLLFSAGCGRIFEGTPAQMFTALNGIKKLPEDTLIYPAHEYTLSNLTFARVIEPDNKALMDYETQCLRQRSEGRPTLPSTLATELDINPFLRTGQQTIQTAVAQHAGQPLPEQVDVFRELRRWKDG